MNWVLRVSVLLIFIFLSFVQFKNVKNEKIDPLKTLWLPANGEYSKLERINFNFFLEVPQDVEIRFTPGNISGDHQVEIEFNGQRVGYLLKTSNRWGGEGWGCEERKIFKKNEVHKGINHLSFVQTDPLNKSDIWGVRNVYFHFVPQKVNGSLNPPDQDLQKAKELLHQRISFEGNLWKAKLNVDHAVQKYLQKNQKIPSEILSLRKKIIHEINAEVQFRFSKIQAKVRLGDLFGGKREMFQLMKEFPDPKDPYRMRIWQMWVNLTPEYPNN